MPASLLSNVAIVKAHDRDRYIATLFAPETTRDDLFTLYAFDAEVSRIRSVISDPLPGEIRLQWWREVINGERAGEAQGNALASGIRGVIARHNLPLHAVEAYFDAKVFEFYNDAFPDTFALEAWCGETTSIILQMAVLILDAHDAASCANASGHAGVALGIAAIVQRLPRSRARGQCYLPNDLLSACGIDTDEFVSGQNKKAIKNATDALCELGLSHFEQWRSSARLLPNSVKPAFLPVHNARRVLVKSKKQAHHPAFLSIEISVFRRLLDITCAALL
jgi:15-cis-phytoene synthase